MTSPFIKGEALFTSTPPVDCTPENPCEACLTIPGDDYIEAAAENHNNATLIDGVLRFSTVEPEPENLLHDFGGVWPTTLDEFIAMAHNQICPLGPETESYVDPDAWPGGDHGHTMCYFVGNLLALNSALLDWADHAIEELADLEGLYGGDFLHKQANAQELTAALERIKNSTF